MIVTSLLGAANLRMRLIFGIPWQMPLWLMKALFLSLPGPIRYAFSIVLNNRRGTRGGCNFELLSNK